jgi:hypothetical protein
VIYGGWSVTRTLYYLCLCATLLLIMMDDGDAARNANTFNWTNILAADCSIEDVFQDYKHSSYTEVEEGVLVA